MTASRAPPTTWRHLLAQAVATPGLIHEAYTRFHEYSLHNQLLALSQCLDRGITPGPLQTFPGWLKLGRAVRRGEKALILCAPITKKEEDKEVIIVFTFRARWFTLSQTDGEPYQDVSLPAWSEELALHTLGITRVPFTVLDGNTQGYALAESQVAVSPVAALPHKTLFHELAHVLLKHPDDEETPKAVREAEAEGVALLCCETLGLPGAEYARGYLQHWLQGNKLAEESAQRIMKTAEGIIAAGRNDEP